MRTLTLNQKQQHRVDILIRLDAGTLDASTAAQLLGVSPRQVRRLRAGFTEKGMQAVIHGNQERTPGNRTNPANVECILELAAPTGKYHELNVWHLHDLLAEQEQIIIGRSTLDRLLRRHGLRGGTSSVRKVVHRRHRGRRAAEGMMLQMDASPFEWLKDQQATSALLGAVDDATGKIVSLVLRPTEDQAGYLILLRWIAKGFGLPMAIYHDRHTILRSPKQATLEEELAGEQPMSQIQRLMGELGIESIPAHSPQAKGRVERLWGTLQDRLVKELGLVTKSPPLRRLTPS
jgi:transposase